MVEATTQVFFVPIPQVDGLFCDAALQDNWRTSLINKDRVSETSDNNALVEGQVLYVLSDKDIYNDGNWTDRVELWGGIDGCVITGGSQAEPLNPGGNPIDAPGITAFQGGGGKIESRRNCVYTYSITFSLPSFR